MIRSHLDHIVVTAPTLEAGAQYVYHALGVRPEPGGVHERMGTHNMLMRLGETTYLEVIAVNPHAPDPGRPRWFALDQLRGTSAPTLATWVARTGDLTSATAASTVSHGAIESMSRGTLNWLITVPSDGALLWGGLAPTLIEWKTSQHPASNLQDLGVELIALHAFHPKARLMKQMLEAIGFAGNVLVEPISEDETPYLAARVRTPNGERMLGRVPSA